MHLTWCNCKCANCTALFRNSCTTIHECHSHLCASDFEVWDLLVLTLIYYSEWAGSESWEYKIAAVITRCHLKDLSLIEGRWVWTSTYEGWHSWTAPMFSLASCVQGRRVYSLMMPPSFYIIVSGLQNPTSLQFQKLHKLLSKWKNVCATMFWSILHRAL